LRQYRLVVAERELLQRTLSGSVQLLTEVLSLVNPVAFSRATRIERYAMGVVEHLDLEESWQIRLAAMLSQLGCVTVPAETLNSVFSGRDVDDESNALYASHADVAGQLIGRIPRLEGVARIVAAQDGSEAAQEGPPGEVQAAEILRAVADFDLMLTRGMKPSQALKALEATVARPIIEALAAVSYNAGQPVEKSVTVKELMLRMIVDEDVVSKTGMLLVAKGHAITETALVYLRRFAKGEGVKEPFRVLVPEVVGESAESQEPVAVA